MQFFLSKIDWRTLELWHFFSTFILYGFCLYFNFWSVRCKVEWTMDKIPRNANLLLVTSYFSSAPFSIFFVISQYLKYFKRRQATIPIYFIRAPSSWFYLLPSTCWYENFWRFLKRRFLNDFDVFPSKKMVVRKIRSNFEWKSGFLLAEPVEPN